MLFVATTINYMDRQVLSILKPFLNGQVTFIQPLIHGWPTVERTISVNEIQYGYIVWAFQVAYALGVIFAGRLVDRLGCRRGYPIVTAIWSLSAMSHALVRSVAGFGVARFFLGLGESGNFPAAIKATAEWFSPKERALATGIFNSGAGVGAILAPFIVPWVMLHFGWRASFLVTGFFSAAWIVWWSIRYRKPARGLSPGRESASRWPAGGHAAGLHASPGGNCCAIAQTWAFVLGKFLTDPVWWFYLFWLPGYFNSRFKLDLSHIGLPLIVVYVVSTIGSVTGGWLPQGIHAAGHAAESRALGGHAHLRVPGGAHRVRRGPAFRMDGGRAALPRHQRAPGMVGQHLHHGVGYVSRRIRRHGGQLRAGGRSRGRRYLCAGGGAYSAVHAQLCIVVCFLGIGLSDRAGIAANRWRRD